MIFTTSPKLQTVPVYLMRVIREIQFAEQMKDELAKNLGGEQMTVTSETETYATMVLAVMPIIVLYPFLQKHFIKGVMIGSIKG